MEGTPFTRERIDELRARRDRLLETYQLLAETSEGFPTWREFRDMSTNELRQLHYLYSTSNDNHLQILNEMISHSEWLAICLEQIVDALDGTNGHESDDELEGDEGDDDSDD